MATSNPVYDRTSDITDCPVCLQSMIGQQARILPCWHSFCHDCLLHLAEYGAGLTVKCPTCRAEHIIPREGVQKFPRNFFLEKLGDEKKAKDTCQSCAKRGRCVKPEYRCLQCDRRLCEICKCRHNTIPACYQHTVEYIGDLESEIQCRLHKTSVTYFCKACLVPLCVDCMLSDKHKNHKSLIIDLGEAILEEKNYLQDLFEQLDASVSNVEKTIGAIENKNLFTETEQAIKRHVEVAKKRAEREGEMLLKELQEKFRVASYEEETEAKVNALKISNKDARSVLTEVEYTLSQSDASFVEAIKTTKNKAKATLAILGQITHHQSPLDVRFLPAKPLAPGRLVGSLQSAEDDVNEEKRRSLLSRNSLDGDCPKNYGSQKPEIPQRQRRPDIPPRADHVVRGDNLLEEDEGAFCEALDCQSSDAFLNQYVWFQEETTRMEAETILQSFNMDGAFIVRNSSNGTWHTPYALSVWYQGRCHHVRVRVRHDGLYAIGSQKPAERTFNSLLDLVAYHMVVPMLIGWELREITLKKYPT